MINILHIINIQNKNENSAKNYHSTYTETYALQDVIRLLKMKIYKNECYKINLISHCQENFQYSYQLIVNHQVGLNECL